ncbi:MAG: MoaD/ThiS family protein [Deltaproteobacteria bacterium]|nr:MoaD/ThiS family protein [Deltaproteobacteria bacterium]
MKSLEEGTQSVDIEVPAGTPVASIIKRLNLKDWEIGFVLINNRRSSQESILKENDELTLVAPLAGG